MDREAWQTTVYRAATRNCAVHLMCLFSVTPYYNLRKKQNKTFFPLQPTPLGHPNSKESTISKRLTPAQIPCQLAQKAPGDSHHYFFHIKVKKLKFR